MKIISNTIQYFLVLTAVLFLMSCSTMKIIDTENIDLIEYGMSKQNISSLLEDIGKLLYVFNSNKNNYNITSYKTSENTTKYLFMYKNLKLTSIIIAQDKYTILNEDVAQFGNNIPKNKDIAKIITIFNNNKLSLEYSLNEQHYINYNNNKKNIPESPTGAIAFSLFIFSILATPIQILITTKALTVECNEK